ncbi:SUKH-4 family immunity protein [Streptomyces sp. NPDC017056]|uniref:SUKH-4 family immunity protein n=1 Tax=Streptomyces sp. NPDC017056 TaxID=3364973 RepID=UPI0037AB3463
MTMPETPSAPEHVSADQAVARIVAWWDSDRSAAGRIDLVAAPGSHLVDHVMREVHRQVPHSVLVDAMGRTTEDVFQQILETAGVPAGKNLPHQWLHAIRRISQDKLILLSHAPFAGLTRRSSHPELTDTTLAETLSIVDSVGVVLETAPRHRRGSISLRLIDDEDARQAWHSTDPPVPLQALALAEPRRVPFRAWRELITATASFLDTEVPGFTSDADDAQLTFLAECFPDHLDVEAGHVTFKTESASLAIRRDSDPQLLLAVNRHMSAWLLNDVAPQCRHAEGWVASGDLGRYAAQGLAMHAVQAGVFPDVLAGGTVLANIPARALIDAAHCAYEGAVPGNNAAADAVYLRMYGIAPDSQSEWAAWLHLMATARSDASVAAGIEQSGVRLPWTTAWCHWRPPGGLHQQYVRPGAVNDLFEVRWRENPAVASAGGDDFGTCIWDVRTGTLLAGPLAPDAPFPAEVLGSLTWATPEGRDTPGPMSLEDLEGERASGEGPHDDLLYVSLNTGSTVVVAGTGGLFAVTPGDPAGFPGLGTAGSPPRLGVNTAAGPSRPVDVPAASADDLLELCGTGSGVRSSAADLPNGFTDDTARRILREVGLPEVDEKGIRLEPRYERFLSEVTWPSDVPAPDSEGPFFLIGRWMGGEIVVAGASGFVLRMPSEAEEPGLVDNPVVATGLDRFLAMTASWISGRRIVESTENDDEAHLLRQHIESSLREIDWHGSLSEAWSYSLYND